MGIIATLLIAIGISQTASAGMEVNSRMAYGNAPVFCAGGGVRGIVWLSNDNSDYYSERVTVDATSGSVYVAVRGSVNTCNGGVWASTNNQSFAGGVASQNANLAISGTEFYRGNVNQGVYMQWSFGHDGIPGGYLDASLNVAGVAPCSAAVGGISTGTVPVGIYRYLVWNQFIGGRWVRSTGGAGTEWINVTVSRSCPANYSLVPNISVSPNVGEPGIVVQPTPSVNNTGTTTSDPAQWQVTQFSVAPGNSVPNSGGGLSGTPPLAYFGGDSTTIGSGSGQFIRGNTPLTVPPQTLADLPVGTRVCFALSVQPVTQADLSWSHSPPACVTIAKSPKVQVHSGDLQVGRGSATNPAAISDVVTSVSNKGGTYYGSWAEYGIIPTGCVNGMASGSGFAGGSPTGSLASLSVLTFTVPGKASCAIGSYTQTTIAPNVSARFPINVPAAAATPSAPADPRILPSTSIDVGDTNLRGSYQAPSGATSVTVTGGTIEARRWVVINAPGATVTITGNVQYAEDPLSALADIPQLVIIAENIIIADNVERIDAWLVAVGSGVNGIVNTCGAGAVSQTSALTYRDCDRLLTVNGPVIANHLIMRRTAGSGVGAQSGDPAEVFNLRADAYIWATAYNLSTGRLSTVATKELPPRF